MRQNRSMWFWVGMLALTFVCAVLINVFSIPAHDELCCAFWGQSTPIAGDCPRVASLMDIVRQQHRDYMNANGRVFVHAITAFFAGFRLYYVFDVLNSIVWFVFVFLILKESDIEINMRRLFVGCMLVFTFWWYDETVSMNADFATDYLWMACASVAVMRLYRKVDSWWWFPVGFVYGWGQEVFSLPMVVALCGSIAVKSVMERRCAATKKQMVFVLGMIAGVAMLVSSPGIHARADRSFNVSVWQFLFELARWLASRVVSIWPMVLLSCIVWLLWQNRRVIVTFLYEDLEWWLFFGAAFGIAVIMSSDQGYRVSSGWVMAGIVLLFKNRGNRLLESNSIRVFSFVALAWMMVGTGLQISYGLANLKMLRIYKADEQGVTYREIVPPALWNAMCDVGLYNKFHLNVFRLDCQKDAYPIILTKSLYETLYENPAEFLSTSKKMGDVYVRTGFEGLAVKRGKTEFSKAEKAVLKEGIKPSGWRRCLPGRIRIMFPSEVENVNLPSCDNVVSFVAKDGNWYTIYKY